MVSSEFAARFGQNIQIVSDKNRVGAASSNSISKQPKQSGRDADNLSQLVSSTYNTAPAQPYGDAYPQPQYQYSAPQQYNAVSEQRNIVQQMTQIPASKPTATNLRSLLGDVNTAKLPSFVRQASNQQNGAGQQQNTVHQQHTYNPPQQQQQQPMYQQQYAYAQPQQQQQQQPSFSQQYAQLQSQQPAYSYQQQPVQYQYNQQQPLYQPVQPQYAQPYNNMYQQQGYPSQQPQQYAAPQQQQPQYSYNTSQPLVQQNTARRSAGSRSVMSQPILPTQKPQSYAQLNTAQLDSLLHSDTPAAASRNLKSSNSYVSWASKQSTGTKLGYKPYKLSDYHALPKQHKLGSLGPNIDDQKLQKLRQIKEYERQVRETNTARLQATKLKPQSPAVKQPTIHDRIKQYTANIPKPKARQYARNADLLNSENVDSSNMQQYSDHSALQPQQQQYQLQSQYIQYEQPVDFTIDDSAADEQPAAPSSPLSQLLKQHSTDRNAVHAELQRLRAL